MADRAITPFDLDALRERLRQPPPRTAPDQPWPSRWTLQTIRAAVPVLASYSVSGVWRVLHRAGIRWRQGRGQQYSPDPDYGAKRDRLLACLTDAAVDPGRVALVFLDEMGLTRWPEPGREWAEGVPVADKHEAPNGLWRLVGAVNARTGQVDYLDAYIVGREKLVRFYRQLDAAYPEAERICVVQDNWSIHTHPDVLTALATLPRIEPVWLPTYAPWLNPIEKLWRLLRQTLLRQHQLAGDFDALKQAVRAFLDQFREGATGLLGSIGLCGAGLLAHAQTLP